MHELLVNLLYKPAQEKVWLGELLAMTIAVDLGHKALKQTNKTKMIAMPILGKTLLNIFSGTTNILGTWYLVLGVWALPGLHKRRIWVDLDLFDGKAKFDS